MDQNNNQLIAQINIGLQKVLNKYKGSKISDVREDIISQTKKFVSNTLDAQGVVNDPNIDYTVVTSMPVNSYDKLDVTIVPCNLYTALRLAGHHVNYDDIKGKLTYTIKGIGTFHFNQTTYDLYFKPELPPEVITVDMVLTKDGVIFKD